MDLQIGFPTFHAYMDEQFSADRYFSSGSEGGNSRQEVLPLIQGSAWKLDGWKIVRIILRRGVFGARLQEIC